MIDLTKPSEGESQDLCRHDAKAGENNTDTRSHSAPTFPGLFLGSLVFVGALVYVLITAQYTNPLWIISSVVILPGLILTATAL